MYIRKFIVFRLAFFNKLVAWFSPLVFQMFFFVLEVTVSPPECREHTQSSLRSTNK